jgi:excisionase family DNA binding protein
MLLKTDEVAKRLYMDPYTIRKYVRQGKLKATKIGKQYLIEESEVERILNEHQIDNSTREVR